nr:putative integron gene cassette protein [uncultured bacterium]
MSSCPSPLSTNSGIAILTVFPTFYAHRSRKAQFFLPKYFFVLAGAISGTLLRGTRHRPLEHHAQRRPYETIVLWLLRVGA